MVDIYEHIIDDEIFKKMTAGKCTFLVCVNDKNVQTYKEGNLLTFVNEATHEELKVKISRFFYFPTIKELASTIGVQKCGYRAGMNLDKLEDEYHAAYSSNKIEKFGFVAVEFSLVK